MLNWVHILTLMLKVFLLIVTYVISDLNGEEIVGTFYEKKFQKTN